MKVRVGARLRSSVCRGEFIVVKAPQDDVDLRCGGHPLLGPGEVADDRELIAGGEPAQLGKRYSDADDTLELLCTKAGDGSLSIGDRALELKAAKPLPASD